jgi:hypothetical protein
MSCSILFLSAARIGGSGGLGLVMAGVVAAVAVVVVEEEVE